MMERRTSIRERLPERKPRHHAVRYRPLLSAAMVAVCGYAFLIGRSDAQTTDAATAATNVVTANAVVPDEEHIPTKSVIDMFFAGGILMYPILLSSFVLLLFTFERLVSLRRGHVIPKPFVRRFLQQLGDDQLSQGEALVLCEENGSHVAKVFAAAVRKWGKSAVEVEQAIIDAGERVTNDLRKYLRVINGVSTVGPLLGLLGTVTGMIAAFNSISAAAAMGRPELLAVGISEALLTTAFGLFVAIPALIIYLYFAGRVDKHIMEIDELGQKVVELISAEALSGERPERSARSGKKNRAA
jgi:biopolymer transport protein ExbB